LIATYGLIAPGAMMTALAAEVLSEHPIPVWRSVSALRRDPAGTSACGRDVAEEVPLAISYNGFAHAVMMGTPRDLEDFAAGFSLAEGVITALPDMKDVAIAPHGDGIAVQIMLSAAALQRHLALRRARSLRGHTSCGVCGVEDLAQLETLPTPTVRSSARPVEPAALAAALDKLRGFQPLSARTHGAHAAAWVRLDGTLALVREDVGRHNALDKLIGAGLRAKFDFADGFGLITSRCSYEMVQKAVAAGMPALVAISAPTGLAIRTAQAAGLTLLTLDRGGGYLIYASPNAGADSQNNQSLEFAGARP
jgi:FdhD protein